MWEEERVREGVWKVLLAGALLIGATVLVRVYGAAEVFSPEYLREYVESFGVAGPLVYVGLYVALVVLFFPASVLSAVGGVLFGTVLGVVYTVVAATIAAALAFELARLFGRDFVEARLGSRLAGIRSRISGDGFWSMMMLRLLFLPYIPLSYAAGLTGMSLWDFTLATFLTNIPGSFAFTYFGASLFEPRNLLFGVVYIGLVMCIPWAVKRWKKKWRGV